MKYFAILFSLYCFFKTIYYGIFEIREKNNKPAGTSIIFIGITGLIISLIILLYYY